MTRTIIINYIYSCGFRRLISYLDLLLSTDDSKYMTEISAWGRKIEYVVNHDYIKIFLNFNLERPTRMFVLNEFGNILMNDSSVKEDHLKILIDNFMMHKLKNACYYDKNIKEVLLSNVMNEALMKLNLLNILSEDIDKRVFFCYLPNDEFARSTIGGYIFLNIKLMQELNTVIAVIKIFAACEYLNIIRRSASGMYDIECDPYDKFYIQSIAREFPYAKRRVSNYVLQTMYILFGSILHNIDDHHANTLNTISNWRLSLQIFKASLASGHIANHNLQIKDCMKHYNRESKYLRPFNSYTTKMG